MYFWRMKSRLKNGLLQAAIALMFTALIVWHMEVRGPLPWGYEIVVCMLIGMGISVSLYVKSIPRLSSVVVEKNWLPHVIRLLCSMGALWLSYLLFEEVLFRYSSIQYSVIYQSIRPFLVIATYFYSLKFLYRLRRVTTAIFVTELILGADFVLSFFADTMGELYYPASLLFVILFMFPAMVRFRDVHKPGASGQEEIG
jgi:hypothetical protein